MVTWGDEMNLEGAGISEELPFSYTGCERAPGKESHLRGKESKGKRDGGQILERGVKLELQIEVTLNKGGIDQEGRVGKTGSEVYICSTTVLGWPPGVLKIA